ncbi:hypothetical protein BB14905_19540 [Bacillus sp. B14905]|nr:hypothetical protein BB14905_19540 [Bacillus sp. B14905]
MAKYSCKLTQRTVKTNEANSQKYSIVLIKINISFMRREQITIPLLPFLYTKNYIRIVNIESNNTFIFLKRLKKMGLAIATPV